MRPRPLTLALITMAACTPYAPDLAGTPFLCGSDDPPCPDGYACKTPTGGGTPVCTTGAAGSGSGSGGACASPFTGDLATWTLTGSPGTQSSSPASAMASGVTATDLARSINLVAAAGTNSLSASNWTTGGQPDTSAYFTFGLTPPAGCSMAITGVALDLKASTTGPASAALATSADAFGQTQSVSTSAPSTPTVAVSGQTAALEVRIYGFSAGASTGTLRVQNVLTVTGSLQ